MSKFYRSLSATGIQIAVNLQDTDWFTTQSLSTFFRILQRTNLSTVSGRKSTYDAYNAIARKQPYYIPETEGDESKPPVRFGGTATDDRPDYHTVYTCLSYGYWVDIITNVLSILTTPPSPEGTVDPNFIDFYNNVDLFEHLITTGYGSFNFLTFEAAFGLFWK